MDRTAVANRFLPPRGARIIVVGGCGGIGAAIVERLTAAECEVAILDLPESLALRPQPAGLTAIAFDGRDEQQVIAAFEELAHHWSLAQGLVVVSGYAGPLEHVGQLSSACRRAISCAAW